jgi:hypothetical protein
MLILVGLRILVRFSTPVAIDPRSTPTLSTTRTACRRSIRAGSSRAPLSVA